MEVPQAPGDELVFQLQPDDEEEDGEQPVGRPGGQRQIEVETFRSDNSAGKALVTGAPRRIRPDQRQTPWPAIEQRSAGVSSDSQ